MEADSRQLHSWGRSLLKLKYTNHRGSVCGNGH